MKKLSPILLVLIIIGLSACSDDTPMKPLPQITWEVASGRFQVLTGEALTLMPTVTHTDETTTYTWQTEQGETVGHASTYTFSSNNVTILSFRCSDCHIHSLFLEAQMVSGCMLQCPFDHISTLGCQILI